MRDIFVHVYPDVLTNGDLPRLRDMKQHADTGANSILEVSRDWLAHGAAAGRRVRLGAETGPLPDCPQCTFAQEGATALGNELAKVDAATRGAYAFAGIAVHRYSTWRALPA